MRARIRSQENVIKIQLNTQLQGQSYSRNPLQLRGEKPQDLKAT